MAKRVLLRRGTQTDHQSFIGEEAELTFDVTLTKVRVHDGVTTGGFLLAREDELLSHASRHELGGADEVSLDASQTATGQFDDARISQSSVDQHGTVLPDPDRLIIRDSNGRAQVVAPVNQQDIANKDYVESLINGLAWQEAVIDRLNTPPGTPNEGDRYLIDTSPTGDWVGHANEITEWVSGAWEYYPPMDGWAVNIETTDTSVIWNGTAWVNFGSAIKHNSTQGLQGGVADEYYHLSQADYSNLTDANAQLADLHTDSLPTFANVTLTITQWGYLGAMDQGVEVGANVDFGDITQNGNAVIDETDMLRIYDTDGTELSY